MSKKAKKQPQGPVAVNKKARHLYELSDFIEAGISLTGPEVKSIRKGQVNFQDSYVEFRKGSAFLVSLHIAPYENAGYVEQDPDRDRRLLLHAREIARYAAAVEQKGLTVVPVKVYFHSPWSRQEALRQEGEPEAACNRARRGKGRAVLGSSLRPMP